MKVIKAEEQIERTQFTTALFAEFPSAIAPTNEGQNMNNTNDPNKEKILEV